MDIAGRVDLRRAGKRSTDSSTRDHGLLGPWAVRQFPGRDEERAGA